jgi:outer membrane protein assembly factor BamB
MTGRFTGLVVWLVVLGLSPRARAADWPGLRGPTQDGVATGEQLADSWPAAGPPILWSRELGQGYSSFAIVGDLAYTQYQTAFSQFVICLERDTGHTVWETRVGDAYELVGLYPGPRSTPAVFEGAVYYTTPDGEVGALDARTGRQRWSKPLQADLKGDGTEFGYAASPILTDGRLFLPMGGPQASVVALSLADGEIAWQSGSQPASYCSSCPITLQGQPLLVSYLQNHLVIQDRTTGRQLWQTELSVGYDEHSCMPVYREPILVVSAPFQAGATAYELRWKTADQSQSPTPEREPELSVKQLWHQPQFSHDVDSATLVGDTIYGFDLRDPQSKAHRPSRGEFRAVNIRDGEILWSSKSPGQANLVAVGGDLLLLNDAGELIRMRADRTQYTELGRMKLFEDEVCWTPPALSSGVMLVRSHTRAIAIRVGPDSARDVPSASVTPRPRRWLPRLAGLSALLLQGEREHPFMRPERHELVMWYVQCMAVALLPLLLFLFGGRLQAHDPSSTTRRLQGCLLVTALLGVLATPVLNRSRSSPSSSPRSWPRSRRHATPPTGLSGAGRTSSSWGGYSPVRHISCSCGRPVYLTSGAS